MRSPDFAGDTNKDEIVYHLLWHTDIYGLFKYGRRVDKISTSIIYQMALHFDVDFINKYKHLFGNQYDGEFWVGIMSRPDITWNAIVKHGFYHAANPSMNPNITWRIIKNNPSIKWDFVLLSKNRFRVPRTPT